MAAFLSAIWAWIIARFGGALTGLAGWLISLFANKIIDAFKAWITKLWSSWKETEREKEQGKIDEANQTKYDSVTGENSAPSQEELDKATSDLLNGRKP